VNWLVPVALYGFVPLVAVLFALLPPLRAVIVSYLVGWLFLPVAGLQVFGFFDYTKLTAVPLVVFLAVLVFDPRGFQRLRLTAFDLPVILFCVTPLLSSLANDLGWYDALSALVYQTITWGLPYLVGRIYFSSPLGLRQLALGVLAGGLIYVPLCLWEIRMSPQLHATVYGFHQHDWTQTLRFGGYRPMVFLQHGLMVGLWMGAAALVGVALWMNGRVRRLWGTPLSILVPALLATTVLCKSFGATALLLVGVLSLAAMRKLRTSLPMALLVCLPATYVVLRTAWRWSGSELTELVSQVSPERASSLAFRLEAEERLRTKALERPVLGWGGWGRSFVRLDDDPLQGQMVITDSLWILEFGKHGAVGLGSLVLLFLVPVLVLWRRCPPRSWASPGAALPWALALVLTVYALDNLVNAMENPVYLLIAGGLCGLAPAAARARAPAGHAEALPRAAEERVRRARTQPGITVPVR
jgi:hypothetical protein